MPDIACPVCHSMNAPTRTFCWKCAADLHAVAPDPTAPPPPPKVVVPIQPILIGIGVAVAAIALIALLVVVLGGTPAASISPGGGASAGPTGALSTGGSADASAGASSAPTDAAATEPPATRPPKATAAPATPAITPVPKPKIVSFKGPKTVDCLDPAYDGFITLSWLIDNADSTELSIDGFGLYHAYPGAQFSDRVPFSCGNGQHTYTLTTVGGEGPAATKTLTITEQ